MVINKLARAGICTFSILSFIQITTTQGYRGQAALLCPGDTLFIDTCREIGAAGNLITDITSVSIYSSDNLTAITQSLNMETDYECFSQPKCERIIRAAYDPGLSVEYKYFYNLILSQCQGKQVCTVKAPTPSGLLGETSDGYFNRLIPGTPTVDCPPQPSFKFFSGLLITFDCQSNILPTHTPPPSTTRLPEPPTEGTTPSFPVLLFLYQSTLNSREKVILGIAIGLAVVVLLVLLISLHCWEKSRKRQKKMRLMTSLGLPHAQQNSNEYDEYGKREAWEGETTDEEVLAEYTGVKPNEFITMKSMETPPMSGIQPRKSTPL